GIVMYKIQVILLTIAAGATGQTVQGLQPAEAPPDSIEQKKVLADAAEFVLHHEINLPNFICTQVTRRFEDATGRDTWRPIDIIVERLTYFDHKEDYRVVE